MFALQEKLGAKGCDSAVPYGHDSVDRSKSGDYRGDVGPRETKRDKGEVEIKREVTTKSGGPNPSRSRNEELDFSRRELDNVQDVLDQAKTGNCRVDSHRKEEGHGSSTFSRPPKTFPEAEATRGAPVSARLPRKPSLHNPPHAISTTILPTLPMAPPSIPHFSLSISSSSSHTTVPHPPPPSLSRSRTVESTLNADLQKRQDHDHEKAQDHDQDRVQTPRTRHVLEMVNTRDVEQIKKLKGVGIKKAKIIVDSLTSTCTLASALRADDINEAGGGGGGGGGNRGDVGGAEPSSSSSASSSSSHPKIDGRGDKERTKMEMRTRKGVTNLEEIASIKGVGWKMVENMRLGVPS